MYKGDTIMTVQEIKSVCKVRQYYKMGCTDCKHRDYCRKKGELKDGSKQTEKSR